MMQRTASQLSWGMLKRADSRPAAFHPKNITHPKCHFSCCKRQSSRTAAGGARPLHCLHMGHDVPCDITRNSTSLIWHRFLLVQHHCTDVCVCVQSQPSRKKRCLMLLPLLPALAFLACKCCSELVSSRCHLFMLCLFLSLPKSLSFYLGLH